MGKDYNKVPVKNNMQVEQEVEVIADQEDNRPKLQSVVSASPKKVKRSLFSRLISGIVGPEGASSIGGYVNQEIIKPAIKNIIVDAVTSGINMVMYGDRGVPSRGGGQGNMYRPRTNYSGNYSTRPSSERSYSREPISEPRPTTALANTSRYGVDEYLIADRYDASHVLTTLTECADRYGMVSIADYYDLIKVPSNFTDNSYGWTHEAILAARILPVRGGYIIKFPPVTVL